MKKCIFINILTIFISLNVNAQTYNVSQLIGTKWHELTSPSYIDMTLEFTPNEYVQTMKAVNSRIAGVGVTVKNSYYLSPSIPTIFDKTKVGKNTQGKYLVLWLKGWSNCMDYFKIESISQDTLKLFHRQDPTAIGGADVHSVFVRIKEK